jgi:hypothetical protein
MHTLQKQHIVDVSVWIDDPVIQPKKRGQQPALKDSGLLTILIWDGITEPHKNLSEVYSWIRREYAHCHRLLPTPMRLLQSLLCSDALLRFCDSTTPPVCRLGLALRLQTACCRQPQRSIRSALLYASPMRKRLWKKYGIVVVVNNRNEHP